jgi:hypothetical protein
VSAIALGLRGEVDEAQDGGDPCPDGVVGERVQEARERVAGMAAPGDEGKD